MLKNNNDSINFEVFNIFLKKNFHRINFCACILSNSFEYFPLLICHLKFLEIFLVVNNSPCVRFN